jgi:signal transduction histidine kinase
MANLVWYRSLYWRIALGFVLLLAILLAAQSLVFLWLTGRVAGAWFGRSASELAQTIAGDLSTELTNTPDADLDQFLNGRYRSAFRSFVVVMRDGHVAFSHRVQPPPQLDRVARARLSPDPVASEQDGFRRGGPPDRWNGGMSGGFRGRGGPPSGGLGAGRGPGGTPPAGTLPRGGNFGGGYPRGASGRGGDPRAIKADFATITIAGKDAGLVAVPTDPPPLLVTVQDLWPTLTTVGLGLLVAGTAIGALLVFRPTHHRLQAVQQAALALGAGDTSIRAPETGGDEVTALAHAFNEMAGQLEQRTNALEAVDRTRRQLLADVSHELTTPLAAIKGYVETLGMEDVKLDEATRARYLRIVEEEAERLDHIVGDLLDLAKLEGGGGTLRIQDVAVSQLLERIRHRHGPVVTEKQIDLDTRELTEDLSVPADPIRLEQAVQNLVSNAARHTPVGGRIQVQAEQIGHELRITVSDTGPGIPAEHLPHVFDRFYKVDVSRASTDTPSGSGLGLSIVQAIVARHGGRVTAGNGPAGGARFEVWLPLETGDAEPDVLARQRMAG